MQTENKPGGRIVLTIEEYRLMRGISKNKDRSGGRCAAHTAAKILSEPGGARLCDYLQCDLSDLMHL